MIAVKKDKTKELERAVDAYEPPERAPYESDRKVHFLNYMASELPYVFIPYAMYLRAIRALSRTPSTSSAEVLKLAKTAGSIGEKLLKQYGRDLCILPGYGVRATVDEDDRLNRHHVLQNRASNAVAKAVSHAATITVANIKDAKARAAFIETRKIYGSMLSQGMAKIAAMLPPKPEDREDRKKNAQG